MGKINIIGTGLNGLVGSRLTELLQQNYNFLNVSRQTGINILNKNDVLNAFLNSKAPFVLHFAAKTNVDGCEEDKEKDIKILEYKDIKKQEQEWQKEQTAWAINVLGTKNVVDACLKTQKKLIYISTDFVFDGINPPLNGYTEKDIPSPINWYGKSKYEGEKVVQESGLNFVIARIAYPYRSFFVKNDFLRAILQRLKNNEKTTAVSDHTMTPTFIDDIVIAIDTLIKNQETGIFHLVGSQFVSPLEAIIMIANSFNLDKSLISKTTREEYFKDKAERPFCLKLKNDKIGKLGVKMKSFEEGLEEFKKQINVL